MCVWRLFFFYWIKLWRNKVFTANTHGCHTGEAEMSLIKMFSRTGFLFSVREVFLQVSQAGDTLAWYIKCKRNRCSPVLNQDIRNLLCLFNFTCVIFCNHSLKVIALFNQVLMFGHCHLASCKNMLSESTAMKLTQCSICTFNKATLHTFNCSLR